MYLRTDHGAAFCANPEVVSGRSSASGCSSWSQSMMRLKLHSPFSISGRAVSSSRCHYYLLESLWLNCPDCELDIKMSSTLLFAGFFYRIPNTLIALFLGLSSKLTSSLLSSRFPCCRINLAAVYKYERIVLAFIRCS